MKNIKEKLLKVIIWLCSNGRSELLLTFLWFFLAVTYTNNILKVLAGVCSGLNLAIYIYKKVD